MKIRYQGSPDTLKTLYEALGGLQQEITDLEDFEHRNDFREDWRGWKYEEDGCTRCERFRQPSVGEGVYGKV